MVLLPNQIDFMRSFVRKSISLLNRMSLTFRILPLIMQRLKITIAVIEKITKFAAFMSVKAAFFGSMEPADTVLRTAKTHIDHKN